MSAGERRASRRRSAGTPAPRRTARSASRSSGATGYVGGRARAPAGPAPGRPDRRPARARPRRRRPSGTIHPHLADDRPRRRQRRRRTPTRSSSPCPTASPPGSCRTGSPRRHAVIDLGPDFRLRDPADYPRWYGFEHPAPGSARPRPSTACPSSIAPSWRPCARARRPARIVGAPGCYPTATLLALAPLARAGLIGDLVVDAKSGVCGAGREAKADLMFGEVNESVRAYGVGGHRHVAEIEQELARLGPRGRRGGRRPTPARPPSTSCPTSSR